MPAVVLLGTDLGPVVESAVTGLGDAAGDGLAKRVRGAIPLGSDRGASV